MKNDIRDLSVLIAKPLRNRIARVGVELEGGWVKLPRDTQLAHDGSIHFPDELLGTPGAPKHIGEMPSPPRTAGPGSNGALGPEGWETWVRKFYPSHVHATCGMHVHMSFPHALMYQRLMEEAYQASMFEYLEKWAKTQPFAFDHPIWARLKGNNTYCKKEFFADAQARATSKNFNHNGVGNRYTGINFAYLQHSTVECRILPMFERVEEAVEAINQVLLITNAFLVATATRERPHDVVFAGGGAIREEIIECL